MHRSLARDAAISLGLYDLETGGSLPATFAVVSRASRAGNENGDSSTSVWVTRAVMDASLLPAAMDALKSSEVSRAREKIRRMEATVR